MMPAEGENEAMRACSGHMLDTATRARARGPIRARSATDRGLWPANLPPKPLDTAHGNAGVLGRVLGISVPEVVLHRAQIRALVGKIIAAAVSEHVGPDSTELGGLAGNAHDVVDCLPGHRLPALADKQPR